MDVTTFLVLNEGRESTCVTGQTTRTGETGESVTARVNPTKNTCCGQSKRKSRIHRLQIGHERARAIGHGFAAARLWDGRQSWADKE